MYDNCLSRRCRWNIVCKISAILSRPHCVERYTRLLVMTIGCYCGFRCMYLHYLVSLVKLTYSHSTKFLFGETVSHHGGIFIGMLAGIMTLTMVVYWECLGLPWEWSAITFRTLEPKYRNIAGYIGHYYGYWCSDILYRHVNRNHNNDNGCIIGMFGSSLRMICNISNIGPEVSWDT